MPCLLGFAACRGYSSRASASLLPLGATQSAAHALPGIAKDFAVLLASSNVALRQSAKQSTLYSRIIQDVMVDNAVLALRRRLPLRSGLDLAFVALIDFDKIKVFIGSLPSSWAISVYRALWGGWPTSARYHEENRMVPVCGCWRGSDHQRHYFWCPTI